MVDPVALLTLGSYTTGNIGDYEQTHSCSRKTYQSTSVDGIVVCLIVSNGSVGTS